MGYPNAMRNEALPQRHKESICRPFDVLKSTIAPGCPEVMESLTSAVNFIQYWKKKILKIISEVSKLCLKAVSLFEFCRH